MSLSPLELTKLSNRLDELSELRAKIKKVIHELPDSVALPNQSNGRPHPITLESRHISLAMEDFTASLVRAKQWVRSIKAEQRAEKANQRSAVDRGNSLHEQIEKAMASMAPGDSAVFVVRKENNPTSIDELETLISEIFGEKQK